MRRECPGQIVLTQNPVGLADPPVIQGPAASQTMPVLLLRDFALPCQRFTAKEKHHGIFRAPWPIRHCALQWALADPPAILGLTRAVLGLRGPSQEDKTHCSGQPVLTQSPAWGRADPPAFQGPFIGAILGGAAATLVLLAVSLLPYYRWRSQKRNRAPSTAETAPSSSTTASLQVPASPHTLQEGEVVIAMDEDGAQIKLGEGAFGEVRP